jgi:hypothetical protein
MRGTKYAYTEFSLEECCISNYHYRLRLYFFYFDFGVPELFANPIYASFIFIAEPGDRISTPYEFSPNLVVKAALAGLVLKISFAFQAKIALPF